MFENNWSNDAGKKSPGCEAREDARTHSHYANDKGIIAKSSYQEGENNQKWFVRTDPADAFNIVQLG